MKINEPYGTNIIGETWRKVVYLGFNQNRRCHVVGLYDEHQKPLAVGFEVCQLKKDGSLELDSKIVLNKITSSEREYLGGILKKL